MNLSDFKCLIKIKKERKEFQANLDELNKKKVKLNKKNSTIYPIDTLPTEFNSDFLSYQTDKLIGGSFSLNELPKGIKYDFSCNALYEGKSKDGVVKCSLNPKQLEEQEQMIKIITDIARFEAKIKVLDEEEREILAKEENNHQNSSSFI